MARRPCWEVKKCGREPGGALSSRYGVCPGALCCQDDGFLRDSSLKHCWRTAGTFSGGRAQGTCASKLDSCAQCECY